MEWDVNSILELSRAVQARHRQMRGELNTDRRNFSAIWNRYLGKYGATLLFNGDQGKTPSQAAFRTLVDVINYKNELVSDSILIDNPDRLGQYILMPREMAEKILVLGMI